jgi:hypothetical protein
MLSPSVLAVSGLIAMSNFSPCNKRNDSTLRGPKSATYSTLEESQMPGRLFKSRGNGNDRVKRARSHQGQGSSACLVLL